MNSSITVIDYGVGNLYSISKAFEYFGASVKLTDNANDILKADRLVLPGVGAFARGFSELSKRNLVDTIKTYARLERPLLAICLGMQLMLESSLEFGDNEGLGLVPGKIIPIPSTCINNRPQKIPRIGWNQLLLPGSRKNWKKTILEDVTPQDYYYFIHSFMAAPKIEANRLADYEHNGRIISAAICQGYSTGCQFHPEKSGASGLKIIKNFTSI
jgi:glutamine amidotransferase